MTESLISQGGTCATGAGIYDVFRPPVDPGRLVQAQQAAVEHALNRVSCTAAEIQDLVRVALTEYERRPAVELTFPAISVDRGPITFPLPARISPRQERWMAWGPRRRVVKARATVKREVAKVTAFGTRVADTRAVWHGTKIALTDAELDEMREDW